MYEIETESSNSRLNINKPELLIIDYTILNRLQSLAFELQSILYNYNKSCMDPDSKRAIYLETYVNYIGEIFNQSILSNQNSFRKDLEKEIIYQR
ncbi:MAG: hypothetical protein ACW967_05680 [Candidatus Hodarchaeales archaeon]|jgi:hypothetical protein